MSLAENLKRHRTSLGLTQFELSELCDVSYTQIQRYEQGKSEPRKATAIRLAMVFGLTVEQLKASQVEAA